MDKRVKKQKITFAIRPGVEVLASGKRGFVTHVLDMTSILVRDAESEKILHFHLADIKPIPGEDINQANTPLDLIPDEDWQAAQRKLEILRPLLKMPNRTRRDVEQRAREVGVNISTLYKWLSAYESVGRLTALMPRKRNDRGSKRLHPEVEAIIQSSIEDIYLTPQRKPVSKVCEEVRRRCLKVGLELPHPNTVRKRIASLSEYFLVKKRLGRKEAEKRFSPIEGKFPNADYPLSVVQIDHTQLDIILVDDHYRKPVGRPWITLAIDVFSRMVAGFYVSFDPPGAMSTGLCLAHAILPKETWLAKRNIDGEWPLYGLPAKLHLDNAKEFRGSMLQRACAEYGIDIDWRPVGRPHFGGHIERLLGTASREIHTLPGATFSNPQQRGDYDSENKAALTLSEFEEWLTTYIVKVYHQRTHSSIGMSPFDKYYEGIFGTREPDRPGIGLPPRIVDENTLRLNFTPFIERTIQDYGVVIDDIHYYHDVLRKWIGTKDPQSPKSKRKFLFRRDPRDISTIWFYDPELGTYFPIPYRDTSHPSISIWELREAEKSLKQAGKPMDERALFEAYEQMRAIEEEATTKTKATRRSQQRRRGRLTADKPMSHKAEISLPEIDTTTPIEPFDELDLMLNDR